MAYVTGLVNQELLLQNEYLAAENRILKAHSPRNLRLSDGERSTLGESASVWGAKGCSKWRASPNPIPFWAGIANWSPKSSMARNSAARPADRASVQRSRTWWFAWPAKTLAGDTIELWERWATWGTVSDQTVGKILRRHGIAPVPERSQTTTWRDFIRRHMDVLAGTDFFTVEVLTWRGLVTYYVLFFIHLGSRRVSIAGISDHPDASWMSQVARHATFEELGCLHGCHYVLQDRDAKFCAEFRQTLAAGGCEMSADYLRSART